MSLTARLYIENEPKEGIKVLSFSFGFSQDVNNIGNVQSSVRIGMLNVTIPGTNNKILINWMKGRDTKKKGEIKLSGYGSSGDNRSILFEDGLLVDYHESYSDPSDTTINLTISCRQITVLDVPFSTEWVKK